MRRIAAAIVLFWVSGCATLSEDECLAGNWRSIGFEDGAQGQAPDRVGEHRSACERHGITPNFELWRLGYDEGLTRYCTRDNGFRVGSIGQTYRGVCAGPAAAEFLPAFNDGHDLYQLRQAVDQARYALNSVVNDMRDARHDRDRLRNELDDPDLTDHDRDHIRSELAALSDQIRRLRRDRHAYERDVDQRGWELDDFEHRISSYYSGFSGWKSR